MRKIIFLSFALVLFLANSNAQDLTLKHVASYQTNTKDSAETVAYSKDTQRAYFTNSSGNSLTIIDVSTPSAPSLILTINLTPYGTEPTSVAVYGDKVAVTVLGETKQDNGKVLFFNLDGDFKEDVEVGALPDMITFNKNGTKLLVANEGEPSKDYSNDPEGTISIISFNDDPTLSPTVKTLSFEKYNDKKMSLLNKGIRIFGNNGASSVAQDLEPEFITITPDNTKAYVTCQENNAFVIINLIEDTILDIVPIGYKNHNLGTPSIQQYTINQLASNWPSLGAPVYDGGQPEIMLGGFSGLYFDKKESTKDSLVFFAVPDRGPNTSTVKKDKIEPNTLQNVRPFKLPNYQGRIVKFTLNKTTGNITLNKQILLNRKDGFTPITGKGNIPGYDEVPVTFADAETDFPNIDYTASNGETYHALDYDTHGGDFEGVLKDKDGNFWMCDEYRPSIYKFKEDGTLIERYVAKGTSKLGITKMPEGTYGKETLPEVYSKRAPNRGFEAIAYNEEKNTIYAFIQTPLYNPSKITKEKSDAIRILEINASNGIPIGEYVYLLERNRDAGHAVARVDKIGDAVYLGNKKFLLIERDSSKPDVEDAKKYIFEIDITYATNILNQDFSEKAFHDKQLEEMTADEIANENIVVAHKTKVLNLPSIGYKSSDKAEGIALLPNNEIAVLNDNDFGLAGAGITDKSVLGIISFAKNNGFDASDKDEEINITNHPTLGMLMPDGITSYRAKDGKNYIVSANEGDSRDYKGYSEEVRVKDLTLNPLYYSNAIELQKDENLGRLKTTTATGDYNNDGLTEQIYSYGARSFSIFDEYANLVYDSADTFGQQTAINEPDLFNQNNAEFDKRSDDKGVEPEAIEIATISNKTYAFIGLERQSSILVYDITDPKNVEFITYYKGQINSGDTAPEIIKHAIINENDYLLVGYEVSGSIGIINIETETLSAISNNVSKNTFKLYPNPVVNAQLHFNKKITANIYSIKGQLVTRFKNKSTITIKDLASGVYVIKTKNNGVKRFIKL